MKLINMPRNLNAPESRVKRLRQIKNPPTPGFGGRRIDWVHGREDVRIRIATSAVFV